MPKKVLIAAGGTGGHLFPAQILAKSLQVKCPSLDVRFAAADLSSNKRFAKEFEFADIESATFQKNPLTWPKTGFKLFSGVWKALSQMRASKPDLVVGFGSYHTAPVIAAAALLGVPFVQFEANSVPGRVIRLFSKRARWTGIYFPECEWLISGQSRLVDMPLRKPFLNGFQPTRQEAARYFGIDPNKKTVLIFGGSQGAKRINELMVEAYPFVEMQDIQYLHFTGDPAFKAPYKLASVKAFEERMEMGYAAADLCISRSGAATIAELQAFQLPAIFIPYPHAADNHQEKNGRFVENVLGAGFVLREQDCTGKRLASTIDGYFSKGLQLIETQKSAKRLDLCEQILMELKI